MRKGITFPTLTLAALLIVSGLSQQNFAQNGKVDPDSWVKTLPVEEVPLAGVIVARDLVDDWDPYMKTVKKRAYKVGMDERKVKLKELKAEAERKRDEAEAKGNIWANHKTSGGNPPTVGTAFFGNLYGGGDPADNAIAISEGGKIMSGNNTRFHMYDDNGAQTSSSTLISWAQGANLPSFGSSDPWCEYDPIADRFVGVFISGFNPSQSRVVVGFSQTNDPSGAWNLYTINGNVNNMGVWIDYPQVGLGRDELFITGNPFFGGGGASDAVIWQIEKADGYAGAASLTVQTHLTNGFSIHPVEGGVTLYGPNFFLIESEFGSSNSIKLYEITNTIANGGVLNNPISFTMNNSYSIPPRADQKNSTEDLRTNDTRIQSSYIENDWMYFTINTGFSGMPAILLGEARLIPSILSFSNFEAHYITEPGRELAYAAVAYGGAQEPSGRNQTFITTNYAGTNYFPGCGAFFFDDDGLSPFADVRPGVNFINAADDRWGDYADCHNRKNHPGEVWMAHTMGNSATQQRTYIAQLFPPQPVNVESNVQTAADMTAAPNPVRERVMFHFPVDVEGEYNLVIRDLQGRTVGAPIINWLKVGEARVAFNTGHLANGTYFASIESDSNRLYTKKIVVAH